MKREWPLSFDCAHPGCREKVRYSYETKRDLQESFELRVYSGGKWKCSRHSNPERVMSPDNLETHFEAISDERPHGKYWGQSGLMIGPGYYAECKDFPAGTKIIITARIELPKTGGPLVEPERT